MTIVTDFSHLQGQARIDTARTNQTLPLQNTIQKTNEAGRKTILYLFLPLAHIEAETIFSLVIMVK